MPKDNEVDDKVMPVAWWVPNARSCQDGSWEEGPGYLKFADETDGAERKYGTALYSAATVAELRADVSALSHELDCVNANWQASMAHAKTLRARADAAERRVGELKSRIQSALANVAVPKMSESRAEYFKAGARAAIAAVNDALTGADPT